MSAEDSVAGWIEQLKNGDKAAVEKLWQRYRERLVQSARSGLRGWPCRVADEEDVTQDAMLSFWRRAVAGRFPDLRDLESLWHLLSVIVKRTAIDQRQHERRKKRGGGWVRHEPTRGNGAGDARHSEVSQLHRCEGREAAPDQAVAARDACHQLLGGLPDPQLRCIVLLKLHAYTNEEIAELLGCARSTVARKLSRIRQIWLSRLRAW